MTCENIFCIYYYKNECLLDEISISISGQCEMCIYINPDENFLHEERMRILRDYGDDYLIPKDDEDEQFED